MAGGVEIILRFTLDIGTGQDMIVRGGKRKGATMFKYCTYRGYDILRDRSVSFGKVSDGKYAVVRRDDLGLLVFVHYASTISDATNFIDRLLT